MRRGKDYPVLESNLNGKIKTAVLTEIISPYRVPVLNELAADPRLELDVFFFAETEGRRAWRIPREQIRFNYRVLPGLLMAHRYQQGPIFFNPGIWLALFKGRYRAVVCFGYHHPTIWLALLYCRLTGTRSLVWSESTLRDVRSSSRVVEAFKRVIIRYCDGFVAAGAAQADYLRHLGAHPEQIWVAPDSVDSDFFTSQSQAYRIRQAEIKRDFGAEGPVVLYVGRLLDAKGILELLAAFERVVEQTPATLVLVGDGPDKSHYEQMCCERQWTFVHFEGFHQQEDLPRYYGMADVFVLPTYSDPWGLVLNEAMCAGLPIICSTAAGAAADLVQPGRNGFLHEPGDAEAISRHLMTLLADDELRCRMGTASREIIQDYSPQKMAQGFAEAVLQLPNRAYVRSRGE